MCMVGFLVMEEVGKYYYYYQMCYFHYEMVKNAIMQSYVITSCPFAGNFPKIKSIQWNVF